MQHEFDNTIDLLLRRQTGREDEVVFAENAHFEPDEIAAFAEDVLSPPARARYVAHFADCNNCRQVLSNFLLINEAEEEILAAAPEMIQSTTKLTVRERIANFFTLPVLGYATAAMTILLVGSFAFVALRSPRESNNAMVVFSEPEKAEKIAKEKNPSAPVSAPKDDEVKDAPPEPEPTPDNSNIAIAETFPSPDATPADLPPSVRLTRNQNNAHVEARRAEPMREDARITGNAASNSNSTATNAPPTATLTQPSDGRVAESEVDRQRREAKEKQAELAENDKLGAADNASGDALPLKTAPRTAGAATRSPSTLPLPKPATNTRAVGGKSFARENNVWKDSAYGRQNLNTIRRGSDEYKNLDAGLRSIAETLGGTVIIVWQGKAYRIQ
jgi:hypothetical protein